MTVKNDGTLRAELDPLRKILDFLRRAFLGPKSVERAAVLGFAAFFCLMAGYYALRPVRDLLGSEGGPQELAENFTLTFVVTALLTPLYAKAVHRFDRRRFFFVSYGFLTIALLAWAAIFALVDVASVSPLRRSYFVWISAYSLFLTSMFWSAMADAFRPSEGKMFFGGIAAGATCGGVLGPEITGRFAEHVATKHDAAVWSLIAAAVLTTIGVGFLTAARAAAAACRRTAAHEAVAETARPAPVPVGRPLDGLRVVLASPFLRLVACYLALATLTGAFAYNAKSELARAEFPDRAARLAALSGYESWTNIATLVAQLLITPLLLRFRGAGSALTILPFVQITGSVLIGLDPVFAMVAGYDVFSRAARHGVTTPTRESLFTAVEPHEKFQAKAFIDTVVYRFGDVVAAWLYFGARLLADDGGGGRAASLSIVNFGLAPVGLLWIYVARRTAAAAPSALRSDKR